MADILLPVEEDRLVGRVAGDHVDDLTPAQVRTLLDLASLYQPLDSDLTSIAALTTTSFGRAFLALADAAATRTALSLVVGTDVEAHDTDLTTIAGLSPSNDDVVQRKAGAWANRTIAQLLVDLAAAGTTFQPLDSDLTAIAALTTTSYGRAFLALANAAAAATAIDSNTTASTQAIGDAASTGTIGTLARGDHKHAMPAFATNAVVLGSAAAAGSAATLIRSDATIAAFDATSPTTQAFGDAAAVGTAAFAARRDHKHAMPAAPTTIANDTLWAAAGDIAVATANDTAAVLAVGSTAGQQLVVEPGAAGKHAYGWGRSLDDAYLAPTGGILQSLNRGKQNVAAANNVSTSEMACFGVALAKGEVITSISFLTSTTAAGTPLNQFFAILDSSRAPLAFTADDTSTAWAANTVKTLTISGTYTVPSAGFYYIGYMVKATTVPTLNSVAVDNTNNSAASQAPLLNIKTSGTAYSNTASIPNPVPATTVLAWRPFFYLS